MKTSAWKEYHLSQMMLGTVQFGLSYGVANRTGQPAYQDVVRMIDVAVQGGVNCFDTAAAYGNSEQVLGQALSELNLLDQVLVVSKVQALTADEHADRAAGVRAIVYSVAESRRRLRLDCLPLVLFHREADMVFEDVLVDLKRRGWLNHYGVSGDSMPGPAAEFVAAGRIAALQLPASVLDHRHQQSGIFQQAAAAGMAVFLRSAFLQGLLLMPESEIPVELTGIIPVRRQLEAIGRQAGMQLCELAIRYLLAQDGVTCVLTGVETVTQVQHNLRTFERGPLPADLAAGVCAAVPDLPAMLLTPSMWPPCQ